MRQELGLLGRVRVQIDGSLSLLYSSGRFQNPKSLAVSLLKSALGVLESLLAFSLCERLPGVHPFHGAISHQVSRAVTIPAAALLLCPSGVLLWATERLLTEWLWGSSERLLVKTVG